MLLEKDALFRFDGTVDGRVVLTPVTIGIKGNNYYEVLVGLVADAVVILDSVETIEDGMKVKY